MGARGPVPKRSSQRRRRNKESKPQTVKVKTRAKQAPSSPAQLVPQPAPNGNWHPEAKRWYASLAESGQAHFFEPSDWQAAHFLAGEISTYLRAKKKSAMMFSYIWGAMADMLTTEGARRRVKMEIERQPPETDHPDVPNLDAYRDRAAAAAG